MSQNDRDLDLNATMALTQRLLGESLPAADKAADDRPGHVLGQNMRYWLWRAGGRKRVQAKDAAHVTRLLDNYEIELQRLHDSHGRDLSAQKQAHDRLVQEIEATHQRTVTNLRAQVLAEAEAGNERLRHELGRERQRIAQLEHLVAEFQRVYQGELARARQDGRAEGQAALDQAADRLTALEEELAAQQIRHAETLRQELEDEAARAERVAAGLRAELAASRAEAEAALTQAKAEAEARLEQAQAEWLHRSRQEQAELAARLDQAAQDKIRALEQAERAHLAEMAALRTCHAEELAEIRTAGEWGLSDARRQIADLRLRLGEQDDSHAEEIDALRRQHKAELAQWLERFEQAQSHQEIRHAGEYAGSRQALSQDLEIARAEIARLRHEGQQAKAAFEAELERSRQRLVASGKSLAEAETRADRLADELAAALRPATCHRPGGEEYDPAALLAQEREAHARLLDQWREQLDAARAAARAADARAEQARAEADRRRHARDQSPPPASDAPLSLHQVELDRLTEEHALALARLRLDSSRRIADLERQLAQARQQAEPVSPPPSPAPPHAEDSPLAGDDRLRAAMDRVERAESETRIAENKIGVLRDALALAKARGQGDEKTADDRFREAKRAFARAFHPDQGGRGHPDKAALFLEFWPVLERIDADES